MRTQLASQSNIISFLMSVRARNSVGNNSSILQALVSSALLPHLPQGIFVVAFVKHRPMQSSPIQQIQRGLMHVFPHSTWIVRPEDGQPTAIPTVRIRLVRKVPGTTAFLSVLASGQMRILGKSSNVIRILPMLASENTQTATALI